jgi:hypothetical protein
VLVKSLAKMTSEGGDIGWICGGGERMRLSVEFSLANVVEGSS